MLNPSRRQSCSIPPRSETQDEDHGHSHDDEAGFLHTSDVGERLRGEGQSERRDHRALDDPDATDQQHAQRQGQSAEASTSEEATRR